MKRTILLLATALIAACSTSRGLDRGASADPARAPVATKQPFEVEGKVQSVSGDGLLGMEMDSLTVAREDAPAATLHVDEKTQITLDDRPAKLEDLREGDEVKVAFDFDGDRPVAIQIAAEPAER